MPQNKLLEKSFRNGNIATILITPEANLDGKQAFQTKKY